MEELHQSLHQQLGGMETERNQIAEAMLEIQGRIGILDEAILEVQRRIGILDAVMSWTPLGEECGEEIPQESGLPDVKAEPLLIGGYGWGEN